MTVNRMNRPLSRCWSRAQVQKRAWGKVTSVPMCQGPWPRWIYLRVDWAWCN